MQLDLNKEKLKKLDEEKIILHIEKRVSENGMTLTESEWGFVREQVSRILNDKEKIPFLDFLKMTQE